MGGHLEHWLVRKFGPIAPALLAGHYVFLTERRPLRAILLHEDAKGVLELWNGEVFPIRAHSADLIYLEPDEEARVRLAAATLMRKNVPQDLWPLREHGQAAWEANQALKALTKRHSDALIQDPWQYANLNAFLTTLRQHSAAPLPEPDLANAWQAALAASQALLTQEQTILAG